jgi:DNA-binding phage protein
MALTKDFKERVQGRAQRDAEFRRGLLTEAIECLLNDDLETGKALIRDYIKATIGFEALAEQTNMKPKSIMRSLSATGNPTSKNLFTILHSLQQSEGLQFLVRAS